MDITETGPDLLYGMPAIAEFIGLSTAQAKHLARGHLLPTFKLGKRVCARRSTLTAWLAECESGASAEPASAAA